MINLYFVFLVFLVFVFFILFFIIENLLLQRHLKNMQQSIEDRRGKLHRNYRQDAIELNPDL